MKRRTLRATALVLSILLVALLIPSAGTSWAQDEETEQAVLTEPEILIQASLDPGQLPVAPAFVRLLRINLAPEASSPLHTHPGPELGLVEAGTLTVQVNGAAQVSTPSEPAGPGTPVPTTDAPLNTEFELSQGEQIYYLPQTPMTFRNSGSEPVAILSVVVLPAGHQHPPGITYLTGQPPASAFEGVTPEILGDGVATILPSEGAVLTVERIRFAAGESIPAHDGPIMLSLDQGVLDFSVVGGKVQISRTASPGPQPDAPPETEVNMNKGDAVFFPLGLAEVDRSNTDGDIVVLRLTIEGAAGEPEPTTVPDGIGIIEVISAEPTPTAAAEATPVVETTPIPEDDETPTPEPTATPTEAPTQIQTGATVVVTEDGVNVRSEPTINGAVIAVALLDQQLVITGESVEADDFIWWPVQFVDDPGLTGYIVEDFIELATEEE
jgi:quercetin dioxygenase-like cupin family protein